MSHINIWSGEYQVIIKVAETGCVVQERQPVMIIEQGIEIPHLSYSWVFSIKTLTCCLIFYHIITQKNDPSMTWGEAFWIFIKRKKCYERKNHYVSNTSLTFFLERIWIISEKWTDCDTEISVLNYVMLKPYGIAIFESQKRVECQ